MPVRELLNTLASSGKKALVVGLGIRGVESARLLAARGLQVLLVERESREKSCKRAEGESLATSLQSIGVQIQFGADGENVAPLLSGVGLAVLSPGVSLESAIVGTLMRFNVPFVTELELRVGLNGGKSVVITGSNGKSTTAALLRHMLQCEGLPTVGATDPAADSAIFVETASSFQLEACSILKPSVSVVLNLSENHLERHGSLERYAAAKSRCVRLQDENDVAILSADSPAVINMARLTRASVSLFGRQPLEELLGNAKNAASTGACMSEEGSVPVSFASKREEYNLQESALFGAHSRSNVAAAVLAARTLGASQSAVQRAISSFAPLEHRLEVVGRTEELVVVNDSKSTTVGASLAALRAVRGKFPQHPVVLMIGGLSKAGSWEPLLSEVASNGTAVEPLICFGKDGPLLASHCRAHNVSCGVAPTLREATALALASLEGLKKGLVLLSPGCGSFDEFHDFEERGEAFKSCLRQAGFPGVTPRL